MNRETKNNDGREWVPGDEEESAHDPDPNAREEMFESMLEKTRQSFDDQGFFPVLVEHVRKQRLPSAFSFECLTELVRFVIARSKISRFPVDVEECVSWIANCIYDDPVANSRSEKLWLAIVNEIQNGT